MLRQYAVSERRICGVLKLYRSAYRYTSKKDEQAGLRKRITEIAGV